MTLQKLQVSIINIIFIPLALYSLYTCVTCTINYIALPVLLISFFVLACNNKYIQ